MSISGEGQSAASSATEASPKPGEPPRVATLEASDAGQETSPPTDIPAAADEPLPDKSDPRFDVFKDTDLYGSDIGKMLLNVSTLDACKSACLKDKRCKAFTFNEASRACFLKSSAGERKPFAGAISGLRQ